MLNSLGGFHLFLENIIPNLVNLWTRQFKGFELATDKFTIAAKVWEDIIQEMTATIEHIPTTFIHLLGSLSTNCSQFTAKAWGFCFVYLMLILLKDWFPKQKYYIHALQEVLYCFLTLVLLSALHQTPASMHPHSPCLDHMELLHGAVLWGITMVNPTLIPAME
ncbi:hypothetical protein EDD16DRAFT_1516528 [Pisolithus croceorrhizus]|nr:hypothetical protein EV401DRAFT_1886588 [Pisolithus croceorrhizus]KAI6127909.1 hypothetical protein EDD16DRAFT_1516528 [Pisolithus croceorrhizus]KAI6150026.1 hypothetical protein EDD17DRAFT_1513721 [Pisolithus thermaeus]